MIPRLRAALPLAGIVALAAALRLFAIGFGLPYPHARPDEEAAVGHAMAMLHGDPNPHFFNWPSLALYLFAGVLAAAQSAGVELTSSTAVLLSRIFVAAAGTVTVVVTASIAGRIAGRRAGLIAALFLAVAPLHVRESHFAMTDVLMTLLAMIAVAVAMRARDSGRLGLFAAAGAAGGLATSTKYSAAAILAVAAAAPTLAAAALLVGAWGAAFVAGTPFALLDARTFAADVAYDRAHLSGGHAVMLGRGWIYHLHTTLPRGLGLAVALAAVAGVFVIATSHPGPKLSWRRPDLSGPATPTGHPAMVLALFAVGFFALIGAGQTVFFRYALPLVPVACVCAAAAVVTAAGWLSRRTGLAEPAIAAALAALLAAPSFYQGAQLDRLLARTDSRVLAASWLVERLRPEQTLHDSGGDYSRLSFGDTRFHQWRYDAATRSFGAPGGATPDWIVLYESPLPEYTAAPESLGDLVRARYDLAYRVPGVPARMGEGVYDRQDAFFLPIDGFAGVARPGPTVLIYRKR